MAEKSGPGALGRQVFSRRMIRIASRLGLIVAAIALLSIATYRLGQMWLVPEITVAVPKSEADYAGLFQRLEKFKPVTAEVRTTLHDTPAEAAAALEREAADFVVTRPNEALAANGLTAAILRQDDVVFLTWKAAEIEEFDKLAGKKVGIVEPTPSDLALLKDILRVESVDDVTFETLPADPEIVATAAKAKQISAVAFVGRPRQLRSIVRGLSDLEPTILKLGPGAIIARIPTLDAATIGARTITSSFPPEDVTTVSTSLRLFAGSHVERATVSTVLQSLFSNRIALARQWDSVWQIAAPKDDAATNSARLPNHRGAVDFYNREQQTFMDLYGDFLWLGLFAAGGISSAGAWIVQTLSRQRKQLVERILDRLLEILAEARTADLARLEALTVEVDGLVTHAIRQVRWRATDSIAATALTLAIDSSRQAIADRRAVLLRQDFVQKTPA